MSSRGRAAAALDALGVVLFVVVGRASHRGDESTEESKGLASTLWPFATGTAAGWGLVAARPRTRRAPASAESGAVVCASTVAVGMGLRVLAGQGTSASFAGVSTAFLATVMLGGRAVLRALTRQAHRPS